MAFDLLALGKKLRRYRNLFEASLQEVSQATGIPEPVLASFEEGEERALRRRNSDPGGLLQIYATTASLRQMSV